MSIKGRIFKLLNSHGHVFGKWPVPGTFEHDLRRVLVKRDIRTVLDVGAHEGSYGLLLRKLGFDGEIDSFEPNPQAFDVLSTRADQATWRAYKMALGDRGGTRDLTVYRSAQLASLHPLTEWGASEWNFDEPATLPVEVETLDTFIASRRNRLDLGRTLLKVDTQGHDAAVIAGGRDSVPSIAALQIEMAMVNLYDDVPTFTELLEAALDMGFRIVAVSPVQRDPSEDLVPIEFDGLFVRSDLPVRR